MAIDFTDERRHIEILEERSRTDPLTTLLNRRGLAIAFSSLQSADGYSVLALDLDGFKEVNDAYGHAAGDIVLKTTAARLSSAVRRQDLIARTGGDEFVVIIPGNRLAGKGAANRILHRLRDPVSIYDKAAIVRSSIGGIWTPVKDDLSSLIERADAFLYEAKAAGKDLVRFQPEEPSTGL
nr:GGDEF domain-containing protein [Rhizobium sp. RM]